MKPVKIPYISWRDGRPRFEPSKTLRAAGHKGRDLRHEDGRWYSAGEALDWSHRFAQSLRQQPGKPRQKASGGQPSASRGTGPVVLQSSTYPVSRLVEDWQRSPAWADKAAKTRSDYASKLNVLSEAAPDIWGAEVDSLEAPIIYGLYEELRETRGLSMAVGIVRVLSSACSWGLLRGKFRLTRTNPCANLRMRTPPPRVRFASRIELETQVAVADALGLPEMGDSFILAVWSGQRQGDRLALERRGRVNGRLILRQGKTGAIVSIPEAPELMARLEAASRRREAAGIVHARVILYERTWRPFGQDYYGHLYAELRAVAAAGLWQAEDGTFLMPPLTENEKPLRYLPVKRPEGAIPATARQLVAACPSLTSFTESDFRDTAVTWMALAGATVPEICAVTGHSVQSATRVLKHYLAAHPQMASSAIAKMVSWYDEGGETELGI